MSHVKSINDHLLNIASCECNLDRNFKIFSSKICVQVMGNFLQKLSFVKINIFWKYVFCKCNFDKSLDQNFWIATWVKTELISDSSGKAWSETEWTKFTWPSFCANELNQNWSNRAPEGLTGILCSNTFYDERSVGSKSETSRPVSRATCKTTPWRCVLSSCSFSILPSR